MALVGDHVRHGVCPIVFMIGMTNPFIGVSEHHALTKIDQFSSQLSICVAMDAYVRRVEIAVHYIDLVKVLQSQKEGGSTSMGLKSHCDKNHKRRSVPASSNVNFTTKFNRLSSWHSTSTDRKRVTDRSFTLGFIRL